MKFNHVCSVMVAGAMVLPVAGIGVAEAQQSRTSQQQRSQSSQTNQGDQSRQAGQADQSRQRGQTGQTGQAGQTSQTSRLQSSDRQTQQTQQILASDLKLGNEAEIQLSQLGQQQAENQQVKEYAQQMIQAHRQLNQQLVQAVPQARQASLDGDQAGQLGQASQARQTRTAGQANQTSQARQTDQAGQAGQDVFGMADAGAHDQSHALTTIHQQVAQAMLDQQKQMLQDHQGADFDKAFMGSQIALHQAMLAKLQVYQNHVSDDARQILQQAAQETQQHLEQAKQIMRQLAQDS